MTSDALTRAARAIEAASADYWLQDPLPDPLSSIRARAAILSFLDGEDVVEACARAMYEHTRTDQRFANRVAWSENPDAQEYDRIFARAALAALRALVQEEGT